MYIDSVYDRRFLVSKENKDIFTDVRKYTLNTIEKVGLEAIAVEFIYQHQIFAFGEALSDHETLRGFTRWNSDSVDILDGCYDTYEFEGYLFGEVWMTENGIPMLTAYEIPEGCEDWTEHDWMCEFDEVFFRLD